MMPMHRRAYAVRGKMRVNPNSAMNDVSPSWVWRFYVGFYGLRISKRSVRRQQARNGKSSWKEAQPSKSGWMI